MKTENGKNKEKTKKMITVQKWKYTNKRKLKNENWKKEWKLKKQIKTKKIKTDKTEN